MIVIHDVIPMSKCNSFNWILHILTKSVIISLVLIIHFWCWTKNCNFSCKNICAICFKSVYCYSFSSPRLLLKILIKSQSGLWTRPYLLFDFCNIIILKYLYILRSSLKFWCRIYTKKNVMEYLSSKMSTKNQFIIVSLNRWYYNFVCF